ncbi:hypothetical protein Mpsy_0629 [Methanolobus psychrophilus R15]|nr:hypothetical protein Mpsy_0629 [Methanolobus psychrophilus R15]
MGYRKTSTYSGVKIKLTAEFQGYSKKDFEGNPRCVDLLNIARENGKLVTKRVSLRHIDRFFEAGELKKGDRISFQAWVLNGEVSNPSRVTFVEKLATNEMPSK